MSICLKSSRGSIPKNKQLLKKLFSVYTIKDAKPITTRFKPIKELKEITKLIVRKGGIKDYKSMPKACPRLLSGLISSKSENRKD